MKTYGKFKPTSPSLGGTQIISGHPLAYGMMACWLFNDGAGTNVSDIRGRYPGTMASTYTWRTPIQYHGATPGMQFGDNNTLAATMDCGSIPLDSSNWTIAMRWKFLKKAGTSGRPTAWAGDGPTIYLDTSNLVNIVHSGTIDLSATTEALAAGEVCSLAITRAGNKARIFKNGRVIASSDSFAAAYTNSTNYFIGQSGHATFHELTHGIWDYEMCWGRGLTESEVRQLHETPFCMFTRPLNQSLMLPFGTPQSVGSASITLDAVTLASAGLAQDPLGGAGFGEAVTRNRYHRFHFGG